MEQIPSWRPDINQDVDLIEELIRIKGFKSIKLFAPERNRDNETLNFNQKLFHLSQSLLLRKDIWNRFTWSFTDSKIDNQFSKVKKKLKFLIPYSSDLKCFKKINLF